MMEYYMHGTLSGRIWFDSQFSQDVFSLFYVSSNDFLELLDVLIPVSPRPCGARDLNNSLANKFSQVPTPDTTILHTRTSILEHVNCLQNMISPLVISFYGNYKRGIYTKFQMIDILLKGIYWIIHKCGKWKNSIKELIKLENKKPINNLKWTTSNLHCAMRNNSKTT